VDVGAAEAVDRLLRVADQQQAGVGPPGMRALENAPLQRIGVLELVDQRDRVLRGDGAGQPLAADAVQGLVEAREHVVVTHLRQPLLGCLQARGDPRYGVGENQRLRRAGGIDRREQAIHRLEARMGRRAAVLVGRCRKPGLGGAFDHVARGADGAVDPGLQGGEVAVELGGGVCPAVQRLGLQRFAQHRCRCARVLAPVLPRGALRVRQRGVVSAQHAGEVVDLRQRLAADAQLLQRLPQQGRNRGLQLRRVGPQRADPRAVFAFEHEAMLAPVVAHRLGQQRAFVAVHLLHQRMAAVERVLAQHALAPAVDGEHRCLVHPLRGKFQLPCSQCAGLVGGVVRHQAAQVIVRRALAAEHFGSLGQARADALAQLGSGSLGEGQHEDLRRQQCRAGAAVAQHQAQVQRRDGPGLAGAGAGFDQLHALQGHVERLQGG